MSIQSNINALCKEICLYWEPIGHSGTAVLYADAREINCRWEEKSILFQDETGRQIEAKAVAHVTEDVKVEGFLKHGRLVDLPSAAYNNPRETTEAFIIKRYDKSPAISDPTAFLRKSYLTPYGGMS